MVYIKVVYGKWFDNSLLQTVKKIKEVTNWGLRDAKDYVDRINDEMKKGFVILDEEDGHFHLLKRFLSDGIIDFDLEYLNTKTSLVRKSNENHRVISKRSKEYEKAKAWATSLHPKKVALINLLIKDGYGI